MAHAVDSICGSNIDSSLHIELPELLGKTLELSLRLESWYNDCPPSLIITSETDVAHWTAAQFETRRHAVLISIYYYRTMLLIHGPLLLSSLEKATFSETGVPAGVHRSTISSLLQNDFKAVNDFGILINAILHQCPSFFKSNAAWWCCNYGGKYSQFLGGNPCTNCLVQHLPFHCTCLPSG